MKKIFTLIALAAMALGVNAQTETVYNLGGLKVTDFDLGDGFVQGNDWTDEDGKYGGDAGVAYQTITYSKKDKTTWSDLKLNDTPIAFQYKNSGEKKQFYRLFNPFFYANGKQSRIKVSGLVAGDVVTLKAAGKNDDGAMFKAIEGGADDEANPAEPVGKQTDPANFVDFKFIASGGDLIIEETSAGFHLASITVASNGGGEDPVVDPTPAKTWDFTVTSDADKAALATDPAQWTYTESSNRYSNAEELAKDTDIELAAGNAILEGFAGLLVGRTGGNIAAGNLRIDVDKRFMINATNGYVKILDLKKGDIVYVDFASASTSEEARTITMNTGTGENNSSSLNTDEQIAKFTVNVSGDATITQSKGVSFFKIYINPAEVPEIATGIENVKAATVTNGAVYNLAGQKVSESYKGVVIQNGVKVVRK